VLADLSAKLAPVRNAPNAIVQRFARDDEIAIAGPVLSQSARLSDDDLVEIAKSNGQTHLGAISERTRLAEAVTDILVERGDTDMIHKLSRNRGAAFSNAGFSAMATRAEHDVQLAENLGGRVDLPPRVLHELLAKATDQVRAHLLSVAAPERRAEIQKAIDAVLKRIEGEAAAPRAFTRAQKLVEDMKQRGKLNHAAVAHFAHIGQYELMVAALAQLCLAPINMSDPLVRSPSYEGLMTACKACDFNSATFSAVVAHRFPGHTMPASEVDNARIEFQKMSADTAKRIYRFWLVRGVVSMH